MKVLDIVGEKYGMLTVVKKTEKRDPNKNVIYLCKCDCGEYVEVSSRHLRRKDKPKRDCGCNSRKKAILSRECKNTFKIEGDITYMYDVDGNECMIDTEDLDRVKEFYWRKQNYWVYTTTGVTLHRFLMGNPSNMHVDHVHHNKNDNRKSQLRVCTPQQNQFNKKPKPRKYDLPTGVYKTPYGKYRATIRTKGVKKYKNFNTLEEAIQQRKLWEEEIMGEFRYRE